VCRILLALALLLPLTGCSRRPDATAPASAGRPTLPRDLQAELWGMTPAEVRARCGPPKNIDAGPATLGPVEYQPGRAADELAAWAYDDFAVFFRNGTVTGVRDYR
jgi:hypothetical protein